MIDPFDNSKKPLIRKLKRHRVFARTVMTLERMTESTWRVFFVSLFFAGIWLLSIPPLFGLYGPLAFWAIYVVTALYFSYKDFKTFRFPNPREIDKRLENESGILHRPLTTLTDTLLNPDKKSTRVLWQKTIDRALEKVRNLRYFRPHTYISERDPMALRSICVLVFAAGLMMAGSDWRSHLADSLRIMPSTIKSFESGTRFTMWVDAPDYTGLQTMIIEGSKAPDEAIIIPQDSVIKIRMGGGLFTPTFKIGENDSVAFAAIEDNNYTYEFRMSRSETAASEEQKTVFSVRQFPFTNLNFEYDFVPDAPPALKLTGAPEEKDKGMFTLSLEASDDYGLSDLFMTMNLTQSMKDRPLGTMHEDIRAIMSAPHVMTELTPLYDLAWHPWAGLPVMLEIKVTDHLGQKAQIPPLMFTLPERRFRDPLARNIIELRKNLIMSPEGAAHATGYDLAEIINEPDFASRAGSIANYLGLRSAAIRLIDKPDRQEAAGVVSLLWDIALTIEEGDFPLAARNLMQARENLERLLADPDASQEQIAEAMAELREAMAEYFQSMMQELQKRMADNTQMAMMPQDALNLTPQDVMEFLERLQAEALSGNRNDARELLSQLQEFMDNMNSAMSAEMPPQMQFMAEGVNALQQLIEKQQALLDKTREIMGDSPMPQPEKDYGDALPFDLDDFPEFTAEMFPPLPSNDNKSSRQNQSAPETDPQMAQKSGQCQSEQDALRYVLGQLMMDADQELGEIPENMQSAELEMRKSGEQLGANNPSGSIPHQEQALEDLQEAMQQMSQQLQQMMQNMAVMAMGGMGKTDPLGRPLQEGDGNSLLPGSKVEIPDKAERKRVEEILRTLREKSGDFSRPEYELDYFRRLMRNFWE